jgi:hypothetical protein
MLPNTRTESSEGDSVAWSRSTCTARVKERQQKEAFIKRAARFESIEEKRKKRKSVKRSDRLRQAHATACDKQKRRNSR